MDRGRTAAPRRSRVDLDIHVLDLLQSHLPTGVPSERTLEIANHAPLLVEVPSSLDHKRSGCRASLLVDVGAERGEVTLESECGLPVAVEAVLRRIDPDWRPDNPRRAGDPRSPGSRRARAHRFRSRRRRPARQRERTRRRTRRACVQQAPRSGTPCTRRSRTRSVTRTNSSRRSSRSFGPERAAIRRACSRGFDPRRHEGAG